MVSTRTPIAQTAGARPESAPLSDEETGRAARVLIEEARRRHRRRLTAIGIGVAGAALLAVSLVGVLRDHGGQRGTGRGSAHGPAGVFARPTGDVLVFADGLSLDLDHRVAVREPIAGQRAGDQRWDIVRAGNSLVVGWGEVWATSIGAGSSRLLGPVVTFTPAVERDAVWLVDYPGGRIGEGTPRLREVTTTGRTLRTELGPPPNDGVPSVGIPGGLAFESASGVALWNAADHRFTRHLGTQAGEVGDDAGGTLAWCQGLCTSLHITDVSADSGSDRAFGSPQAGRSFSVYSLRLSPDGRYAAVLTTRPGLGTADQLATLDVLDTRTGRFTVVRRDVSAWSTLSWTPDSRDLFFASDTGLGPTRSENAGAVDTGTGMTIGRFQPQSAHSAVAHVPMTNAEDFVVLKSAQAGTFLSGGHRRARACPSGAITPGVPAPGCAPFTF